MSRDLGLYLADMIQACEAVVAYTEGLDQEGLVRDRKTYHAVLWNLLTVGEAAKHVPEDIRNAHSNLEWRRISGFRDVAAHEYFSLEDDILWDIVSRHVPALLVKLRALVDAGS